MNFKDIKPLMAWELTKEQKRAEAYPLLTAADFSPERKLEMLQIYMGHAIDYRFNLYQAKFPDRPYPMGFEEWVEKHLEVRAQRQEWTRRYMSAMFYPRPEFFSRNKL